MNIMDHVMGWLIVGGPLLLISVGLLCDLAGLHDKDHGGA